MKSTSTLLVLLASLGGAALHAQTTANPSIILATGTYQMPTSTTITDATPAATILWCYAGSGDCTPNLSYTGAIYLNPATTETICANATAAGYAVSGTSCNEYTRAAPITATPSITLTSGTYAMPESTTITDPTSGASILWCHVRAGACNPDTHYTSAIRLEPTPTEVICTNATSTGYAPSGTACNTYTAGDTVRFRYADGQVSMFTPIEGARIFYTLDGSAATEASIEYIPDHPVRVAPGTIVNAAAVKMTSSSNTGVAVQNGQATTSDWKTVLSSSEAQSAPYVADYDTPNIDYGPGNNTCADGVCGIAAQIGMLPNQAVPSVTGSSTATTFDMTTQNLNGAGGGLQVLWPYNIGSAGCDSCTTMIEDFYIWPQYTATSNPAYVENWELDMNSWNLTIPTYGYLGASFQCSIIDGGWQYNGQHAPGWTNFSATGFASMTKITHDCQLPFGTLSDAITSTAQQSFTVAPNVTGSVTAATVEPGMIVLIDSEEILCTASNGNTCTASQRGWAGTTPATHSSGALYSGSVHVQYHVTFKPGDTSVCKENGSTGTPVECVFIDYLTLNGVKYDFHGIYGTQTVSGVSGYSNLAVPAYVYTYGIDRVYDQKQIDVASGIGSPSSPVQVGEFIDRDDVTASFGVAGSARFVVPERGRNPW